MSASSAAAGRSQAGRNQGETRCWGGDAGGRDQQSAVRGACSAAWPAPGSCLLRIICVVMSCSARMDLARLRRARMLVAIRA